MSLSTGGRKVLRSLVREWLLARERVGWRRNRWTVVGNSFTNFNQNLIENTMRFKQRYRAQDRLAAKPKTGGKVQSESDCKECEFYKMRSRKWSYKACRRGCDGFPIEEFDGD